MKRKLTIISAISILSFASIAHASESEHGIKSNAQNSSAHNIGAKKRAMKMMKNMDKNHDKRISREEFLKRFNKIDVNNDGFLDETDFNILKMKRASNRKKMKQMCKDNPEKCKEMKSNLNN